MISVYSRHKKSITFYDVHIEHQVNCHTCSNREWYKLYSEESISLQCDHGQPCHQNISGTNHRDLNESTATVVITHLSKSSDRVKKLQITSCIYMSKVDTNNLNIFLKKLSEEYIFWSIGVLPQNESSSSKKKKSCFNGYSKSTINYL